MSSDIHTITIEGEIANNTSRIISQTTTTTSIIIFI